MATILLVDDNPDFLKTIKDLLSDELSGDRVVTAASPEDAMTKLEKFMPEVVVTDMRMDEERSGLELVNYIRRRSPSSMVILLTEYSSIEDAVTCIRAGCFEYLDKNSGDLLRAIREAKDLAGADRDGLNEILVHWHILKRAETSAAKGSSLEELCASIFQTIPGWNKIRRQEKTPSEEIDLVLRNESQDPYWRHYKSLILVECKNWSKKRPGRDQFDSFYSKILRKGNEDCRLGFFVSLNGVAKTFEREIDRIAKEEIVIVTLNKNELWEIICSNDRSEVFKRFVEDSILGR